MLEKCEAFLLKHSSELGTVESYLRTLSWVLPGRFKDAELASESLSTAVRLLGFIHDHIIAHRVLQNTKLRPLIPLSLHARYTAAWLNQHSSYKWASSILELIRCSELFLEMILKRKARRQTRWAIIFILEACKASIRLFLLQLTRRPVLSSPLPERDAELAASNDSSSVQTSSISSSIAPPVPDHLKNNRIAAIAPRDLSGQPPRQSLDSILFNQVLSTDRVKQATTLIASLKTAREWSAEMLHLVQPLVYVSACMLRTPGPFNPIFVSLLVDLVSRTLRRTPAIGVGSLERSEYARRDRDLVWYLFRGDIWKLYTRVKIQSIATTASAIPVLNLIGALLNEWIPLIDEYHYYSSA